MADLYDVTGGAAGVSHVLKEVNRRFATYLNEGHADDDGLQELKEHITGLKDALDLLKSIENNNSLASDKLFAECSDIWMLMNTAVGHSQIIARYLKQKIRRNSTQVMDDNASLRSLATVDVLMEDSDIRRSTLQTAAHELILKTGLQLLTLVACSNDTTRDTTTRQEAATKLRRQLGEIEALRREIETEDESVVDDSIRQAMVNAQQLKIKAQPAISLARASVGTSLLEASPPASVKSQEQPEVKSLCLPPRAETAPAAETQVPESDTLLDVDEAANRSYASSIRPSSMLDNMSIHSRAHLLPDTNSASEKIAVTSEDSFNDPPALPSSHGRPVSQSYDSRTSYIPYRPTTSEMPASNTAPDSNMDRTRRMSPTNSESQDPSSLYPPRNAPLRSISDFERHQQRHSASNGHYLSATRSSSFPIMFTGPESDSQSSSPREGIQRLWDSRYIDDHVREDLLRITTFPTRTNHLVRRLTETLRWACRSQDKNAMRVLLHLGADPNIQSDTEPSITLLMESIKKRPTELVEILLDGGANVNAQVTEAIFKDNSPPLKKAAIRGKVNALSYAALKGKDDVVETLLARGAQIDFTTGDRGLRPIFIAALAGNASVVERLLSADSTPLSEKQKFDLELNVAHATAWQGKVSVLKTIAKDPRTASLFTRQSYIFFEDYWYGMDKKTWRYEEFPKNGTAIHAAVLGKHKPLETVQYLLSEGIMPVDTTDNHGRTALHTCVAYFRHTYENVIGKLFEFKADINAQDLKGQTPLHLLVQHSTEFDSDVNYLLKLVRNFLSRGANPNLHDNEGSTPWELRRKHFRNSFNKPRFTLHEDSVTKTNREYTKQLERIFNSIPGDDMIVVTNERDPM